MMSELEDREAIKQLIATYTVLGDRGRVEDMAWIFAEDARLMTSAWIAEGRAGIIKALGGVGAERKETAPMPAAGHRRIMRHHLTTCLISFQSPDDASGRTYWINYTEAGADHSGLYADTFQRRDGEWRIVTREVRRDWVHPESMAIGAGPGPRPANAPPLPVIRGD